MSEPTQATDALNDLGYAEAVVELEEILAELDGDEVDVDRLADRVRRAADLVQLCRQRLHAARVEVTRIVADLEAVAPGGVTATDDAEGEGAGEGLFASEG